MICPTCKRPYIRKELSTCSNAFHCCRDCIWVNGKRTKLCHPCLKEEEAKVDPTGNRVDGSGTTHSMHKSPDYEGYTNCRRNTATDGSAKSFVIVPEEQETCKTCKLLRKLSKNDPA